jgi:Icc protein
MRFVHISDLHFFVKVSNYPMLRKNLILALKMLVDDIKSIEEHLDFVAITGDLTQIGDLNSYSQLKILLDILNIPVYVVPGNHDDPMLLADVFNDGAVQHVNGFSDYCIDVNGAQLLGINSQIIGKERGELSELQLSWIKEKLESKKFSRHIILMHHPPFLTGFSGYDETIQLSGRIVLGDMVENSPSKIIILSGHIHKPFQAVWRGANCYIAGAPCFQLGNAVPFGIGQQEIVDEPYAYYIHSIHKDDSHVVSTRYLNLDNQNP